MPIGSRKLKLRHKFDISRTKILIKNSLSLQIIFFKQNVFCKIFKQILYCKLL